MNIAKMLSDTARQYADKPAIRFRNAAYTFGEIDAHIGRATAYFQNAGIGKGDRVALQLPKGMEFIYLHFGAMAAGAISLPLNPAFTPEEVRYYLSDSQRARYITTAEKYAAVEGAVSDIPSLQTRLIDAKSPGGAPPLDSVFAAGVKAPPRPAYPTALEDTAVICYTSGTTGKPKGAMITHRNLISNTLALKETWRWTDADVLCHVLPLFHVHGLMVALQGALNAGASVIMHERFDPPEVVDSLVTDRCTMLMAVPTIYYRLLPEIEERRPDLSAMRVFISGSAPLLTHLFQRFEAATGHRILERYGMTEAQMITSNPYEPNQRIPGSVGYPLPGVRARVVDSSGRDVPAGEVGEVVIQGDNLFAGYRNQPEKTAESFTDGWFHTGDLGRFHPESEIRNRHRRLYLAGRAKELIITGGFNVYPKEIENVLEEHADISTAAVVGLTDPDFGEQVTAFVEPAAGKTIDSDTLIDWCKTKLAGYKCPKRVEAVDSLPRNAMGKIQKHVLKARYE